MKPSLVPWTWVEVGIPNSQRSCGSLAKPVGVMALLCHMCWSYIPSRYLLDLSLWPMIPSTLYFTYQTLNLCKMNLLALGISTPFSQPSKWRQLCFIISGLRHTQITPIGLGCSHISCHIFRYIGWFQVADLILILLSLLQNNPIWKNWQSFKGKRC